MDRTPVEETAWTEMLEYRSRLDRQEHLLDKDLTQDTDDLLADLDAAREERERQVREDIELNGPKWLPTINRHFMDADNSTSNFGPEFHPAYPVVPTDAMLNPSTRLRESAARGRAWEVRQLILQDEAQVNEPDVFGRYAAIHWAALMDQEEALEMLIVEFGADMEQRTRYNRTALHYAAEQGRVGAARVLMRLGANKEARDNDGWTPGDLAKAGGYHAALAIIEGQDPALPSGEGGVAPTDGVPSTDASGELPSGNAWDGLPGGEGAKVWASGGGGGKGGWQAFS
ncbi:ankyrin repeat-containing domain protein [Baffinella frigidus]|nr:ankyrin repeat-containing domain protein [Cryptophyta sp. CCMP2293]